jgi:hypothetical protein
MHSEPTDGGRGGGKDTLLASDLVLSLTFVEQRRVHVHEKLERVVDKIMDLSSATHFEYPHNMNENENTPLTCSSGFSSWCIVPERRSAE